MIKQFTMFRKDKKNALHISTRTAEQVMNCMKGGRKAAVYEVCPNLEMRRDSEGILHCRHLNGVVILTFGGLPESERRDAVKEAAMSLPTSVAAFTGADGESVNVLVRHSVGIRDFRSSEIPDATHYTPMPLSNFLVFNRL